ncbi:MAG: hypothetical protein AB8B53_08935 [Flavobacteriales bacterium]
MKLSLEQEKEILERLGTSRFSSLGLKEEVFDHLCCQLEVALGKGQDFHSALESGLKQVAPEGLLELERKTIVLINSKYINTMRKIIYILGFIASLLLAVGLTFKLMHWPGASIMSMIGFTGLFLMFIPVSLIQNHLLGESSKRSTKAKTYIGVTASVLIGLAGIFKVLHLMGANILLIVGAAVFAFGYLPVLFNEMYRKAERVEA